MTDVTPTGEVNTPTTPSFDPNITFDVACFDEKKQERKQTLYRTIYFSVRFIIVFTTIFLSLIAGMYALSNLITVEAVNIFCPRFNRTEIYEYNQQHNQTTSDSSSCYYNNILTLNTDVVENLKTEIYDAKIEAKNQSFQSIFSFVVFAILALFLAFIGLQNGFYAIYDAIYIFILKKRNGRVATVRQKWASKRYQAKHRQNRLRKSSKTRLQAKKIKKKKKTCFFNSYNCCHIIENCCKKLSSLYQIYNDIYEKYLYFDSKYKVLSLIFGEYLEICVQFFGLCLYGGINLFAINDIVLSQEYYVVESFAIILGLNGIFTGIAWIVYVAWHDTWYVY